MRNQSQIIAQQEDQRSSINNYTVNQQHNKIVSNLKHIGVVPEPPKMQDSSKQNDNQQKNLQFVFSPIMLENTNNEDYFELKSASAHTPVTAQQSESQYNNRIKIAPTSNQDSTRGGGGEIVFTKNMKDLKSEIDCKSIDLKKIEQIKISRDRQSVNFSYVEEKQASNQSITLDNENMESSVKVTDEEEHKQFPLMVPETAVLRAQSSYTPNETGLQIFGGFGGGNNHHTGGIMAQISSNTRKGKLLPKRTGMFGRQPTIMRNSESDDFHMFGSGIRSHAANQDSRISQNQQEHALGRENHQLKNGRGSNEMRQSIKNDHEESLKQHSNRETSKSNKQSGRNSKQSQKNLKLGPDVIGELICGEEPVPSRGNIITKHEANGSSRYTKIGIQVNPASPRQGKKSTNRMREEQSSFSSQEIEDSCRELRPPSDHENNMKSKNRQSPLHNQQKPQQTKSQLSLTSDQKNQRHQMIGNPRKLQIQAKKEGFSAHREAFLKNAAMKAESKNNIKKSTSIPSNQLIRHQSSIGGLHDYQKQASHKGRIKQLPSLRPGQLKTGVTENQYQMPGMVSEPPSPLTIKKQVTGRKFFEQFMNKSPIHQPENDISIDQGGEMSPFPTLPEETPTQRLVRALKVARQIKEQKEKEDQLKLENHSALHSDDSKATSIRRCAIRFSKWFMDHETWIIYPEDRFKAGWDMIILIFVIITCIYAPISLAFNDTSKANRYAILDWVINVFFIGDIIVNCMTAYYDGEFCIVKNHRLIIRRYLMSRFIIDLIAVIPFDSMISNPTNSKSGLQFLQLSRLNRLKRLTRMFQLVKMLHVHNSYIRKLKNWLNIDSSSSRFVFLMINLVLLQHVVACIWIFFAKFDLSSKINWIFDAGCNDLDEFELYITSYYFTVTTIMTVGYGDITAQSLGEKLLAILLMLIGVVAFSFATGSISSIIANADTAEDKLRAKMEILKELHVEYGIDQALYNKVVKALQYGYAQTTQSYVKLLDDLPVKLKVELSMAIHQKIYSGINFFKEKEKNFIAWVGPLLRRMNVQFNDYIYKETEFITEIFFLSKGKAGYVLPRYSNCIYNEIDQGQHFGHLELAQNKSFFKEEKSFKKSLNKHKDDMKRSFTIRALVSCDLLTLSMDDLDLMKVEFTDVYFELIKDAKDNLPIYLNFKKEEIQKREIEKTKQKSNLNSKLSSMILSNLQKSLHENVESPKPRPKLKDRLWTAAQRSLRLQRLTKTQVWDSHTAPTSPLTLEQGRPIRNIFLRAAQLAAEQNRVQAQNDEELNPNYGRSRTSQIDNRVQDDKLNRTNTYRVGVQPLTPMARPQKTPLAALIQTGLLTPRPQKSSANVRSFSSQLQSQRTVEPQHTPTLNGPQPYNNSSFAPQNSRVTNNIALNKQQTAVTQNQYTVAVQPPTPASQKDLIKMATQNKLSDTSDSSSYSTDPNKKEIHEMKTMVTRLTFKMDNFETILTEMRNEQAKMFEMLSNHIMLQQSGSSDMKTDSFENNQYEDNDQQEQQNSQHNQNEEVLAGANEYDNNQVRPNQVKITIDESSPPESPTQKKNNEIDPSMPIASFDNVSALMYQQQLKNSRIKNNDSAISQDNTQVDNDIRGSASAPKQEDKPLMLKRTLRGRAINIQDEEEDDMSAQEVFKVDKDSNNQQQKDE